ncbi:hypothetical protein ABZ214_37985 [Streptomyces iakyrus]|uniref:hypothetical protein n=1 Tax=Streptomyces iakyrus TaxID=68219 RepID=UPI0033BCDF8F
MLDSALAAPLGARAGGTVRLTGPDGLRSYQVSGITDPPREPPRQYAAFHSPREAQRLAGSAQPVRAIGVLAQGGGGGLPGHPRR